MAPRTAKTKKTDSKTLENEVPKQGRNKGKITEVPMINLKDQVDIHEKPTVVSEKKTKRGKRKAANSLEQDKINDIIEETAPPSKKGKKGAELKTSEEKPANEIVVNALVHDQNGDYNGANGDTDEIASVNTDKGKKRTKKELASEETEVKPKDNGKSRKNTKKEKINDGETEEVQAEDKSTAKRRGRKPQTKVDEDTKPEKNVETIEEEVKFELPVKSKKRGAKAPIKENNGDSDKNESQEYKPIEENKKKETKARKGQGKKAQGKEEVKEKEEDVKEKENEPAPKQKKVKKEKKGKGDEKEEIQEENGIAEVKPAKGKRAAKNKLAEIASPTEDESQDTGEPKKKKRAIGITEDAKKKPSPKNKATTDYVALDFSNSCKNAQGKDWNYKIASWNVDGIRAWLSKGGLDYIQHEKPDILCLQEIKCSRDKLPNEVTNLPGYHAYWLCSDKDGYAGVGIYTTKLAMNVTYGLQNEDLDSEGRIITAEYEHFYLICTYVPNAGRNLVTLPKRLQWNEEFRKYVNELDKKKPVIICGDMNVAHNEIDLANPKTNKKNAGFTIEERTGMTDLLGDGFVDTYRHLYPDKTGAYTFWTYMMNSRSKNVGWRLDYFIVSQRILPSLCDNVIRGSVYGSDHCPISLFLHLSSAEKPK
ncbi:DNA-(apurinic or apyrimidinic site) endonuclease [Achroia grisella]|uniref:DNA-(apurinic or apyrimidinic site) endonuclease n=1 Tax=Achroia grisella TaxID=688607 RepID=UPI0027D2A1C4|nr:DNA-(apurinic or apyrimidinic site) endonuclease [Achroia grisella]